MAISLDKDTQLCVSIASQPGNFGTTIHNTAFQACGLNYIYKSFGITDLENAVEGLRAFGIRGCGVSMPYKEKIIPLLDEIDQEAAAIGAINTVVNTKGLLKGYNTDVYGVDVAIDKLFVSSHTNAIVVGAGGMSKAIVTAMKKKGIKKITLFNRTPHKVKQMAEQFSIDVGCFAELKESTAELLVNATSVGMAPDVEGCIFTEDQIFKASAVLDVPTNPMQTTLIRLAESHNKLIIPGHFISLHQAALQFKLYTGRDAPLDAMKTALSTLL